MKLLEFIPSVPWAMYGVLEINCMNALSYLFQQMTDQTYLNSAPQKVFDDVLFQSFILMNLAFTFKIIFYYIDVT